MELCLFSIMPVSFIIYEELSIYRLSSHHIDDAGFSEERVPGGGQLSGMSSRGLQSLPNRILWLWKRLLGMRRTLSGLLRGIVLCLS